VSQAAFGRHTWREALRPARHPSLDGWTLEGPHGVVAERIDSALTPFRRMRGLLGRDELGQADALLIRPCAQVHGIGMRHPFDAVFCDDDLRVLVVATIRPRKMSKYVRGAKCCFELAAGRAASSRIEPGTLLSLKPAP
jgi:uncharacterized membrane protein (UPF0127 family)